MKSPAAVLMLLAAKKYLPTGGEALGLTLGGVPALFIAAFIVKEMPIQAVRWVVVVVVIYTGVMLLRTALAGRSAAAAA